MKKEFQFNYQDNINHETNIINDINMINNDEMISPIENINFNSTPSSSTNYSEPPKKKKFPNYPIKNIFLPELFLEQEYLEKFICGICENVCDDPVVQCCGCEQLFCRKCLLFYYDNNNRECPECKQITKEPIKVPAADITIKLKKMKCINYNVNCTWQGKCKEYKEHIEKKCPKEIINCPYKGCIIKLKREEMDKHMLNCDYVEINCEKCKLKISKNERDTHKEVCLKEKIKCPQGCEEIIERGDFNLHKQNCIYSIISCPFNFLGCPDKFQRKENNFRLSKDLEKHLDLINEKISNFEETIKELKEENQKLKDEIKELKEEKSIENNGNKGKEKNNMNIIENFQIENNIQFNNILPPTKNIISLLENESFKISKDKENDKDKDNEIKNKLKNEKKSITNTPKNYLSNKRKPSHNDESINNEIDNLNLIKKKYNVMEQVLNSKDTKDIINQQNDIYELLDDIKDLFIINQNIIEAKNLNGKKQYYIFFNKKYNIPKTSQNKFIIKFKILKNSPWLGIGICDRKIVARNNYNFTPPKRSDGKTSNIGTYVISTNKMAWNCNNISQCKKFVYNIFKQDIIIECILSPLECEIEFKCEDKLIVKFNDVRCFKSEFFSPCLIFLHNSAVETTFYYP